MTISVVWTQIRLSILTTLMQGVSAIPPLWRHIHRNNGRLPILQYVRSVCTCIIDILNCARFLTTSTPTGKLKLESRLASLLPPITRDTGARNSSDNICKLFFETNISPYLGRQKAWYIQRYIRSSCFEKSLVPSTLGVHQMGVPAFVRHAWDGMATVSAWVLHE